MEIFFFTEKTTFQPTTTFFKATSKAAPKVTPTRNKHEPHEVIKNAKKLHKIVLSKIAL